MQEDAAGVVFNAMAFLHGFRALPATITQIEQAAMLVTLRRCKPPKGYVAHGLIKLGWRASLVDDGVSFSKRALAEAEKSP